MLKDKNGNWVRILEITEELWKKMMQETLNGVIKLLESAQRLLDSGGNEAICAGLYSFAVEEYGKILLLKKCTQSCGKVKIKYKNEFRRHDAKFDIAIKNLPDECIKIHEAAFKKEDFEPEDFDTEDVAADFEARLALFYSDFTDLGDGVKSIPLVDKERLKKAISQLRTIALGIFDNF